MSQHADLTDAAETRDVVTARGVKVVFPVPGAAPVEILHGIDLDVAAGEFVAIMGPSGSGKSTLLYALSGICPLSAGSVELVGEDVAGLDPAALERLRLERLGFVFQQPHLLPGLTLAENVELPAGWRGRGRSGRRPKPAAGDVRAQVRDLLNRMGVGPGAHAGHPARRRRVLSSGSAERSCTTTTRTALDSTPHRSDLRFFSGGSCPCSRCATTLRKTASGTGG